LAHKIQKTHRERKEKEKKQTNTKHRNYKLQTTDELQCLDMKELKYKIKHNANHEHTPAA